MATIWLKKGVEASSAAAIDRNVREVVEATLADIERRATSRSVSCPSSSTSGIGRTTG